MTPKQKYKTALDSVIRRYVSLEDDTVKALISALQDLRNQIAGQVATSEFAAWRMGEMQTSINRMIDEYQARLDANLRQSFNQAARLGGDSVVDPIIQADLGGAFNVINPAQLNASFDYSAALIRNVSDTMRGQIDVQLRLATLGQRSPLDTMKAITDILGTEARAGAWGIRRRPEIVTGVAARSEAIARTEMTRVYNLAAASQQAETAKAIPELQKRWLAAADRRTRRSHLIAHSRYFFAPIPVSQPFQVGGSFLMQPGDPAGGAQETVNCILPGNSVIAPGLVAAARSFYDGPAIELTIDSGKQLTVTPNHPILTSRGFVAAKFLREGDYVIGSSRGNEIARTVDPDNDHVPTRIEEIWGSLSVVAREGFQAVSAVMPHYFHGDGKFIKGNIDIVPAVGFLRSKNDTALPEHFDQNQFSRGNILQGFLTGYGPLDKFGLGALFTPYGRVGGFGQNQAIPGRHILHPNRVGFTNATNGHPGLNQPTTQNSTGYTVFFGESLFRFTGGIPGYNDAEVGYVDALGVSNFHTSLSKSSAERPTTYTNLARQFFNRFAGFISNNQIIKVRNFDFSGHVFDLQTIEQLYISNTFIVKNCRCSMVTIHPAIGAVETPLDKKVVNEKMRRDRAQGEKEERRAQQLKIQQMKALANVGQRARSQILETIPDKLDKEIKGLRAQISTADDELNSMWEKKRNFYDNYPNWTDADRELYRQMSRDIDAKVIHHSSLVNQLTEIKQGLLSRQREVLYVKKPAQIKTKFEGTFDKTRRAAYKDGAEEFSKMVGTGTIDGRTVGIKPRGKGRAFYDLNGSVVLGKGDGQRTAIHELGHWLEDMDPRVHQKALEFYDRRTKGETLEWLGGSYEKHEVARRDKFTSSYMGKEYLNKATGQRYATEIISMGMENMWADPAAFAKADPDYFDFIFGLLRGF